MKLASGLEATPRRRLIEQALQSAVAVPESRERTFAAAGVAACATEHLAAALDIILTVRNSATIVDVLQSLMPRLDYAAAALAIDFFGRLTDEDARATLLAHVSPDLGPRSAAVALDALSKLNSAVERARVLCVLVPRPQAERLLATVSTDFAWLEAVGAMAIRWPQLLTAEQARSACSLITALVDDEVMGAWLEMAAPHWPPAAWPEFFGAVRRISASSLQVDVSVNSICHRHCPSALRIRRCVT